MANAIKFSTLGTFTTGIAGAASAPTLKNLSSGSNKIGNAIDNTSGKNIWSAWELLCRFGTGPTANSPVYLYFVPSVDSTNYADGGDSTTPAPSLLVWTFNVASVTTQQRLATLEIKLPNFSFKPLIRNASGQAFTNTDNENVLSYRTWNEEIQ